MRPPIRSVVAMVLCSTLLQSCAARSSATTAEAGAGAGTDATDAASVLDRNILSRDEILRGEYQTAWDAILARRRAWLIERTDRMRESTPVQVYVDDMRVGSLEELRSIPIARVAQIRYFDGAAAYARWGLGHDRGVIQVTTVAAATRLRP